MRSDTVTGSDITGLLPDSELLDLVCSRPEGWKVHELYSQALASQDLASQGLALNQDLLGDPFGLLGLFRRNFRLMRQLFRLRDSLETAGRGTLVISCMDIRFVGCSAWIDRAEGIDQVRPVIADPLRVYYMDDTNYFDTDEAEASQLLEDFWKRFERWKSRDALLERWGIAPGLDAASIRGRIRELAKLHHPDTGGNGEEFRALWALWREYRDAQS